MVSRDSAVQGDRKDGQGLGYDKVLGTVVTERSIDLLMMFGILVAFLCLKWNQFGAFFIDNIWLPASGRLNLSLWWIALIMLAAVGTAGRGRVLPVCRSRQQNGGPQGHRAGGGH